MFSSVHSRMSSRASPVGVEITPLIDVVFILLLFFLVTTTFVRETGIVVQRPRADTATLLSDRSLRLNVAADGTIHAAQGVVTLEAVPGLVAAYASRNADAGVVIIPDRALPSGQLVAVMDAARRGGARDVAVAADVPEQP